MRQVLCLIYSPFKFLLLLLLSPILTVIYWLILLLTIPISLFRKAVSFLAHRADPSLGKIVNTMGHIVSRDYANWGDNPAHVITVICKIAGRLTLDELRKLISDKWVHKTCDDNRDQLEFPELQQYVTKRLFGFLFFKGDDTFDITNHVNMYSSKEILPNPKTDVVNETTLVKIWESMISRPFEKKRSPWDAYLIPNYDPPEKSGGVGYEHSDEYSLVCLRLHHALSDGAAVYKLLLLLTDNGIADLEDQIAAFKKAPPFFDLVLNLKGATCGPSSLVKKCSKGIDIHNPLHLPLGKKRGQGHIVKLTVDVEKIKKVSRMHLDVSFHSVLIAALAGGIRNYLLGNGYQIPLSPIRMGLPMPKPGHTHKLRNEFLLSVVDLPVEKKTPKERLYAVEKRLTQLKTEGFMPCISQAGKILGLMPTKVVRALSSRSALTVGYSEIKGPGQLLTFLEGRCLLLDLMFASGLGTDDCGMALTSISYNGKVHIMMNVDYSIAQSRKKAQSLLDLIEKELQQLQYGDVTNL